MQWLPLGRRDLVWARRLPRPRVLTAHNVLPHSGEADGEERSALYGAFDRVVVHTRGGAEQLARFGVPAERVVRIPHGTFDTPSSIEPPSGRTLLFFGLIRRYKGLDVLVRPWRTCRMPGSWSPATRSTRSSRPVLSRRSWVWPTGSSGGSATCRRTRSIG